MMRAASLSLLVQWSDSGNGVPGQGWIGTWSPGIGDPTLAGWITVAAYLIAGYLCLRVAARLREGPTADRAPAGFAAALVPFGWALLGKKRAVQTLSPRARLGALWLGLALLLLLLGINKQLDLQTAVTETGRILARREGWYENRRQVQMAFILLVAVLGAWGFRSILLLARGVLGRLRLVLLGTVFLICFVATRAASFHHVDWLLGVRLGGLKVNWILELGGIGLIALGAYRASRTERPSGSRAIPRAR